MESNEGNSSNALWLLGYEDSWSNQRLKKRQDERMKRKLEFDHNDNPETQIKRQKLSEEQYCQKKIEKTLDNLKKSPLIEFKFEIIQSDDKISMKLTCCHNSPFIKETLNRISLYIRNRFSKKTF